MRFLQVEYYMKFTFMYETYLCDFIKLAIEGGFTMYKAGKPDLTAFLKVKTIVTLTVMFVFAFMSLRGEIGADNVMIIVSSVVSFYFGTQHERQRTDAETRR